MKNPYKITPKEELAKKEVETRELELKLKATIEIGKACLDNPLFKVYRDKHIVCREYIIKLMKENSEPDPIKYALAMKAYIMRIDTLDMLIDLVEKDAKKK